MSSGQPYRPPQAASVTRPAPALPSHTLRNVLIVFILLLGGFVAYAYSQNPLGCQKVLADSRDVVVSLVPPGLIPNGILHGNLSTASSSATSASTAADASTTSSTPVASPPKPSEVAPSPSVSQVSPAEPPRAPVIPAQPNWTWTTLDGKTYQNVVITKLDPDTVSITHSTGVSHLPMNLLSEDIQKQLHYNPAAAAAAAAQITRLIDGKLVDATGSPVTTPGSDVQYYAIYYSASWCPSCRTFTPRLVAWYNKFKPTHPNFQLIFVSGDRSESAMLNYMKEASMPWPAVRFGALADDGTGIEKFAGQAIPDLVLVDAGGKVLSDSFNGNTYVGPGAVVNDINRVAGGTSPVPLVLETRPAQPSIQSAFAISD